MPSDPQPTRVPEHTEPVTLHVVRVFTDAEGRHGNPLGVFLEGEDVAEERRQASAADLGFSETVFVDDREDARLRIFTPIAELPFAGHPLVGTAWLLREHGHGAAVLQPPAGAVPAWADDQQRIWVRVRSEWAPEMTIRQLAHPEQVDNAAATAGDIDFLYLWAWDEEAAGHVRARAFAPRLGVTEDEATGAAAVRLVASLHRPLRVRQGHGSLLHAQPGPDGTVELGGWVAHAETRSYAPPEPDEDPPS